MLGGHPDRSSLRPAMRNTTTLFAFSLSSQEPDGMRVGRISTISSNRPPGVAARGSTPAYTRTPMCSSRSCKQCSTGRTAHRCADGATVTTTSGDTATNQRPLTYGGRVRLHGLRRPLERVPAPFQPASLHKWNEA
jgi:hypothetical protein